ncbi:hypothetical protein RND81_13G059900 [Saponaria officinalis]|uniref:Uncharacterized protein n=1 Tax=Saponaria officinalis TaxID=3572 RepID=A0AAW1H0W7_SAPOF
MFAFRSFSAHKPYAFKHFRHWVPSRYVAFSGQFHCSAKFHYWVPSRSPEYRQHTSHSNPTRTLPLNRTRSNQTFCFFFFRIQQVNLNVTVYFILRFVHTINNFFFLM